MTKTTEQQDKPVQDPPPENPAGLDIAALKPYIAAEIAKAISVADQVQYATPQLKPEGKPRTKMDPLPVATLVRYHSGGTDFPAIVISSRIIREGFPPRYLLFVVYAKFQTTIADRTEGEGDEQFSIF